MTIKEYLDKVRKEKERSVRKIARASGITEAYVWMLLNQCEKTNIGVDKITKLVSLYDIPFVVDFPDGSQVKVIKTK